MDRSWVPGVDPRYISWRRSVRRATRITILSIDRGIDSPILGTGVVKLRGEMETCRGISGKGVNIPSAGISFEGSDVILSITSDPL